MRRALDDDDDLGGARRRRDGARARAGARTSAAKADGDGCAARGASAAAREENGGAAAPGEGEGAGGAMRVAREWVGGDGAKARATGVGRGGAARRAARGLNIATTTAVGMYVYWILMGTVAWISHLGERAPWLRFALPAEGYPGNAPSSAGALGFVARNVPLSLIFVVPHSVFLPSRLRKIFGKHGRLMYNFVSAATLHFFLLNFTPLKTPVVMTIPFNTNFHNALSIGCLAYASYAFLSSPATLGLLGVSSALELRDSKYSNPAAGMDAITWMGVTTWRLGGASAFVLFTGLSIIPRELTLGDCITRCVAAVYLRQRSRSFREWVEKIEGVHLLTWILRGTLLSFACHGALQGGGNVRTVGWILFGAASLAGILRLAESESPNAKKKPISRAASFDVAEAAPAALDDVARVNRPERWHAWNPHARMT